MTGPVVAALGGGSDGFRSAFGVGVVLALVTLALVLTLPARTGDPTGGP